MDHLPEPFRSPRRGRLGRVGAAVAWAATAVAAAPTPVIPAAPKMPSRSATHRAVLNPHLHGVAATADRHRPGDERWHRQARWDVGWNAVAWFDLHRGTGTVRGVVRNAQGAAVAGASVRLRDRHGHPLHSWAAKHLTTSGSGGLFLMVHVRSGSYHVRAERDGHEGHASIHLSPGRAAEASIRL